MIKRCIRHIDGKLLLCRPCFVGSSGKRVWWIRSDGLNYTLKQTSNVPFFQFGYILYCFIYFNDICTKCLFIDKLLKSKTNNNTIDNQALHVQLQISVLSSWVSCRILNASFFFMKLYEMNLTLRHLICYIYW